MFSSRSVEGVFGGAGQLDAVHKVFFYMNLLTVVGTNSIETCCDADQFDHSICSFYPFLNTSSIPPSISPVL